MSSSANDDDDDDVVHEDDDDHVAPADAPNKCAMCVAVVVVVGPLIMKFDNDVALRLPDRLLAAAANIADTRPVFRNYFK